MTIEAKRNFGNQKMDILDEIRFVLETQAELMDPAGDTSIRIAHKYATTEADIMDRIRRALERQYKHAGSVFSADIVLTGTPQTLIADIVKQHEVFNDGPTYNIVDTNASKNSITVSSLVYDQQANWSILNVLGCDVGADNGTFTIVSVDFQPLNAIIIFVVAETITGGGTSGTATVKKANYFPVVLIPTGLNQNDKVIIIGSDNNDDEYLFSGESAIDDGGITKYALLLSDTNSNQIFLAKDTVNFGSFYTPEVVANSSIPDPYNSLFTSIKLWKADGKELQALNAVESKSASEFVLSGSFLQSNNLHVGDSIHYSIDSHV